MDFAFIFFSSFEEPVESLKETEQLGIERCTIYIYLKVYTHKYEGLYRAPMTIGIHFLLCWVYAEEMDDIHSLCLSMHLIVLYVVDTDGLQARGSSLYRRGL